MSLESDVSDLLAEVYTDEGVSIWWQARNRNFGGQRPRDMISGDETDRARVLAEAERLAAGAW